MNVVSGQAGKLARSHAWHDSMEIILQNVSTFAQRAVSAVGRLAEAINPTSICAALRDVINWSGPRLVSAPSDIIFVGPIVVEQGRGPLENFMRQVHEATSLEPTQRKERFIALGNEIKATPIEVPQINCWPAKNRQGAIRCLCEAVDVLPESERNELRALHEALKKDDVWSFVERDICPDEPIRPLILKTNAEYKY